MDAHPVVTSTLEVDYDKNLTDLYKAITDQDWDRAIQVCAENPSEAATWVVRRYEAEENGEAEMMWRFLPLHSACARQPPAAVIESLLAAYPDGPKCVDDQGMYALHYACGNQASQDIMRQLIASFSEASMIPDPRGMLPIHYLACWGPSTISVLDMLFAANKDISDLKDADGNTPLDLAMQGDYRLKDSVVSTFQKWMRLSSSEDDDGSKKSRSSPVVIQKARSRTSQTDRSGTISLGDDNISQNFLVQNASSMNDNISYSKKSRSIVYPDDEEKRDVSETPVSRTIAVATASAATMGGAMMLPSEKYPGDASKLQDDVTYLKSRMFEKELDWEMKVAKLESSWQQKLEAVKAMAQQKEDELQMVINKQGEEIESVKKELEASELRTTEIKEELGAKDREILDISSEADSKNEELKGLQATLGDLMEKHDNFKKKSCNLTDRLGSLSVSLESMIEQQFLLGKKLGQKREQRQGAFSERESRLMEIIAMEKKLLEEDTEVDASLEKQTREMEAIAAVIAAARE